MIHPSYVDLMKVVNKDVEEGETPIINSRYSIVMATAKRARQIIDGDETLIDDAEGKKPLSIAVEELEQAKLQILPQDEEEVERLESEEMAAAMALESEIDNLQSMAVETDQDETEDDENAPETEDEQ